jgi:predicted DNA binding CopG/RHH family protein
MEKAMKIKKLPKTDSINELAKFWANHDLTDFEHQLEEVTEPVFAGEDSIALQLQSRDAKKIRQLAKSKGISQAELVQQWVLQRLARTKRNG